MCPPNDDDPDSVWLDEEAKEADRVEQLELEFNAEVEERARVMRESIEGALSAAIQVWTPPKRITVSEWADENRRLSPEGSAEPGRWYTSRAEYMREIMDCITDPSVEQIVLIASSQVGKALALDTPIPTPSGWTTMGDLQVGDKVFDEGGNQCNVTFVTPVMNDRLCYKVEFSDGQSLVADADHQWQVDVGVDNKRKSSKVMTTAEMLPLYKTGEKNNFAIPVAKPLGLPPVELPLDSYCFGVWT